uniref:Uncharacterized protein n=1 Tax=Triticum urartu TaxID=4572 RepID=A0A8R7PPF3_TRIUA
MIAKKICTTACDSLNKKRTALTYEMLASYRKMKQRTSGVGMTCKRTRKEP